MPVGNGEILDDGFNSYHNDRNRLGGVLTVCQNYFFSPNYLSLINEGWNQFRSSFPHQEAWCWTLWTCPLDWYPNSAHLTIHDAGVSIRFAQVA